MTAPSQTLTFNWGLEHTSGFPTKGGTVTGTTSGLLDNSADQPTDLTIAITSAPSTPPGGWSSSWNDFQGTGLTGSSGAVTTAHVAFEANAFIQILRLSTNRLAGYAPDHLIKRRQEQ